MLDCSALPVLSTVDALLLLLLLLLLRLLVRRCILAWLITQHVCSLLLRLYMCTALCCTGDRSLPKYRLPAENGGRGDHVTSTRRAVNGYGRAMHNTTEGLLG